jgi:hypothetical protein
MSDNLSVAIDAMVEQINAKLTEVSELKRATNTLCKVAGVDPMYPDEDQDSTGPSFRMKADEYYGKPFSTAAKMYLQRRRTAVSAEDIMRGLEQGSFDYDALEWKPETRLRAVASSLAKNTAIFHKLPSGLFGLKEWYPEAIERKKTKKDATNDEQKDEAVSE